MCWHVLVQLHASNWLLSVFDLFLSQWIMIILAKGCKPDNFESHNSLKLSFTNLGYESFLEWNSSDILALCETTLDDSIDPGNFFVRNYLSLIWKDSTTQTFFFNCDSLHARLNSRYKVWSCRKKKHKKIKAYRKSL